MHVIFRPSIRRKIVGIAIGLIVLMVLTSVISVFMAGTVGHLLDELNDDPLVGDIFRPGDHESV